MAYYCVNKNNDHEVHVLNPACSHLPDEVNRLSLGNHPTCNTAVAKAKLTYASANGCFYCATACHTS